MCDHENSNGPDWHAAREEFNALVLLSQAQADPVQIQAALNRLFLASRIRAVKDLAKEIGISQQTVYRWRKGERVISSDIAARYMAVLDERCSRSQPPISEMLQSTSIVTQAMLEAVLELKPQTVGEVNKILEMLGKIQAILGFVPSKTTLLAVREDFIKLEGDYLPYKA